ncbi:APC family permease [Rhodococcus ruber]|uniref:APC family permease n=1 Tax=Rhodococcus ruber TaxID=1830 RepID=A0ABT4MHP8_9NOCA|nr:APC family permease [Rhodococcus ruber]MCZ4520508.1 APC family permease [Rhodococcus ruber]
MTSNEQPVSVPPEADHLKRGTIGGVGLTFMVVAVAAPLTAMASNLSLSLGFGVGAGTVGLLVIVAVALTIFASAFVSLARHVTNAGAYYAFIGFGLGSTVGSGAAFVATTAYNMAAAGMAAATGYFFDLTMQAAFDIEAPWYVYATVTLLLTAWFGRRGVEVTKHLITVVSLLQFALLIVLAIAVGIQRPSGWKLDVFSPSAMLDGNIALTLAFCVLSFVGFEATAIYGEEAKAARKSIKWATYASIILLVGVFVVATWSLVAAFDDVKAVAAEDPGALVFRTADIYLGEWSGTLMSVLVTISFFAASVAFHNMAARYHFALGRADLLPARLKTVHPRWGTPSTAGTVQIVISVLVLLPFIVSGSDPIVNLFPMVSGVTSVSLITLMIGCCVSVLVAVYRKKLPTGRWATVIAPSIAGLCLLTVLVVIIANYSDVTGSTKLVVTLMPLLPIAAALYGAGRQRRIGVHKELSVVE